MGTSTKSTVLFFCLKDHPHAYGDKKSIDKIAGGTIGSSPRVWGQVFDINRDVLIARIIPTRMGTS